MRLFIHINYFLKTICLFMPVHVLAAENTMSVQSAANTSLSLDHAPMSSSYLLQLVIGLFVVLLCIVALAWFAKKMNRFQSLADGSLKIIGGISMGGRERAVLLQVGEEQLLLGISPGKINTLHVLDTPIEIKSTQADSQSGNSFSDKLKTMMSNADAALVKKKNEQ